MALNPRLDFRPFAADDTDACLAIFDANCPEYFAPNEREGYERFLDSAADNYTIVEADGRVVGGFGILGDGPQERTLRWILVSPASHGAGIGSAIMERVLDAVGESRAAKLVIGASHRSAPFFERFGAAQVDFREDGWGPGMHRVDMELSP